MGHKNKNRAATGKDYRLWQTEKRRKHRKAQPDNETLLREAYERLAQAERQRSKNR
jgi:hypothetical protein